MRAELFQRKGWVLDGDIMRPPHAARATAPVPEPTKAVSAPVGPLRAPKRQPETEKRMAAHLMGLKALGIIADYAFEPVAIRLADDCHYTPDFRVFGAPCGCPMWIETKGKIVREDSRIKFKWGSMRRKRDLWVFAQWLNDEWHYTFRRFGRPLTGPDAGAVKDILAGVLP